VITLTVSSLRLAVANQSGGSISPVLSALDPHSVPFECTMLNLLDPP